MKCNNPIHCIICCILLSTACQSTPEKDPAREQGKPVILTESNRWASSTMKDSANILRITIHDGDNYKFITEGHLDYKPVWSKEGDMITFFRDTGDIVLKPFHLYRTHICIINSDGTGLKKLTDAKNPNLNPTWTRDGSNRIIFNRMSKRKFGKCKIFWMSADAELNDTLLISNPDYFEWAESGLKDGRIFIFRISKAWYMFNIIVPIFTMPNIQSYFLLDPENQKYYPVKRANKFPTQLLSLSPSETKVTYMKDLDGKFHTYNDNVIAYADFDLDSQEVKNEVIISRKDTDHIDMYPRWSHDERFIIYSSSRDGNMWDMKQYIYNLNTGETQVIPLDDLILDMYPCFEDAPK